MERATHSVRPRESGDPGKHDEHGATFGTICRCDSLGPRFRGDERKVDHDRCVTAPPLSPPDAVGHGAPGLAAKGIKPADDGKDQAKDKARDGNGRNPYMRKLKEQPRLDLIFAQGPVMREVAERRNGDPGCECNDAPKNPPLQRQCAAARPDGLQERQQRRRPCSVDEDADLLNVAERLVHRSLPLLQCATHNETTLHPARQMAPRAILDNSVACYQRQPAGVAFRGCRGAAATRAATIAQTYPGGSSMKFQLLAAAALSFGLSAAAPAAAAEIKVISANGMREVIAETKAKFEAASGHTLAVTVVETGAIRQRVP